MDFALGAEAELAQLAQLASRPHIAVNGVMINIPTATVIPTAEVVLPDGPAPTADIAVIPLAVRKPVLVFREVIPPRATRRVAGICPKRHAGDRCSICLSKLLGDHAITNCKHCFHYDCLEDWCKAVLAAPAPLVGPRKAPACPLCKRPIKRQLVRLIMNS